uniref:UDP-glucuronosyltransferase n=1 Tax=Poecilia formosa TaxID=48698 RepID=A0A096M9W7_POEFO
EALSEPSYRINMQRLSRLHRDQPMKPIDTALFWIEFAIRHQGAAHLRTESHRLPWYSYYSVDVFLFFLFVVACKLMTKKIKDILLFTLDKFHFSELAQNHLKLCDKISGVQHTIKYLYLKDGLILLQVAVGMLQVTRRSLPSLIVLCRTRIFTGYKKQQVERIGRHFEFLLIGFYKMTASFLPSLMSQHSGFNFYSIPIDMTSDSHIGKTAIVGKNTLLVNWMPQKDLLGHPKVKLFVAHGGTNGVQETIYHGVPIVGLPVFYDQYDNLLRLQDRGAAKILTLATVDKEDTFLKTVKEVLSEPSYRINMQRLSRLHRDQPMKPIDTALFWIEFAKHQGAAHLRTESHRL